MVVDVNLPDSDSLEELTEREREIMTLISAGYSNDVIATRLYLSLNTVKTHIRSGYRKAGVTTRAQAVLWGLRHGLVDVNLLIDPRVRAFRSPGHLSSALRRVSSHEGRPG